MALIQLGVERPCGFRLISAYLFAFVAGGFVMKVRIRIETEFGWGERRSHEIGVIERSSIDASEDSLGISLAEGKSILEEVQRAVHQDHVEDISEVERACPHCQAYLRVHDRRKRRVDTLFGRVTVEAPRMCMCGLPGFPEFKVGHSPLTRILRDNATPELRRLQAELGGRHSFREAARLLNALTPCATQNHATIRNRLASVAKALEERCDEAPTGTGVQSNPSEVPGFLDSAYVRSRPENQRRNFEVIVGSIESETAEKRRFGSSQMGADRPTEYLRSNLKAAGWMDSVAVTVFSDGDSALPRLVKNATSADVHHALDWWHISVRIRHVETTFQTLLSQIEPDGAAEIAALVERLRWRIWHGQIDRALDALDDLFRFAMRAREYTYRESNDAALSAASRAIDLRTYLSRNLSAIVNYGDRRQQGKTVSTSRAEGLVNEIANVRMGKKQRMRWSPKAAHHVAIVSAAVLDGRLSSGYLAAA
jgi:hypothetical protein